MNDEAHGPPPLAELTTLRTDFEDVPVPMLGDTVLRVYALTGTTRALLVSEMAGEAQHLDDDTDTDPASVRKVMEFQGRVAAAGLGYPPEEWDGLNAAIGSQACALLYEVAARLSGMGEDDQAKATARLQPKRKAASGTA